MAIATTIDIGLSCHLSSAGSMLNFLIDPWQYEFMQHAIAIGILVGILCPVVGSYLIVQRMALFGDVIAHAVLPGLSISFFLGIDITIGAFISGILGAGTISWIRSQSRVKVDAAMALTFSTFFAVGIILISVLKNNIDLDSFLFGDILGTTMIDIYRTASVTALIFTAVWLFYKELLFYTFDRTGAEAIGLPVNAIHLGFMSAITLTIIASMQAVGVILVISLLIGPALTAYLLVKELHQMMIVGTMIGAISSVSGVYISFYLKHVPSGPAIVLVSSSLFVLALLFSPSQGILTQRFRSRSSAL
jgi:manganese/iron transport system permease protein